LMYPAEKWLSRVDVAKNIWSKISRFLANCFCSFRDKFEWQIRFIKPMPNVLLFFAKHTSGL